MSERHRRAGDLARQLLHLRPSASEALGLVALRPCEASITATGYRLRYLALAAGEGIDLGHWGRWSAGEE